jgi:hypothetical protein
MRFVLAFTVVAYSIVFWYGFSHKTTARTESASNVRSESILETVGIKKAKADSRSNEKEAQVAGERMKGWLDSRIAENRRMVGVK